MSERKKELVLAGAIAGVVALGSLWGALSSGVEPVAAGAVPGLFNERSLFCPGLPDGSMGTPALTAGALDSEEVRVEVEPQDDEPRDVLDSGIFLEGAAGPSNVVGFGGAVGAAARHTFTAPGSGVSATTCAQHASRDWYLPFGSSSQGSNGFLYLYNPFPDEAVVRVTFYDENGPMSKANLADVAVPAGQTTTLKVNRYILQQETLATEVSALRGRVVAWKTLFSKTETTAGAASSLGARRPMPIWYFPSGAVGAGIDERISLLNPSDEEAIVSISIIGDKDMVQPPELLEMTIPRQSARDVALSRFIPKDASGAISVIVQSINEVGIVAERAVWYGEGTFDGLTSEIGAPVAAPAWWLPPAVPAADRDSVIVLNASDQPVKVDLEFQGPDGPVEAEGVGSVNLAPGGRSRISLDGLGDPGQTIAILSADGLVVAERVGYSSELGDVAAVLGIPIHAGRFAGDV